MSHVCCLKDHIQHLWQAPAVLKQNHIQHLSPALKKRIIKMSRQRSPLYLSLPLASEMQNIIPLLLQILWQGKISNHTGRMIQQLDTSSELKPYGFAHKCPVNHWALPKSRKTNSFHALAGSVNPGLGNSSAAVCDTWASGLYLSSLPQWPV